jgi:hypothetical protein
MDEVWWHAQDRREMRTKFWLETLKGRDHLGDLSVDGKVKGNKVGRCGVNASDLLRLHKRQGISYLAE